MKTLETYLKENYGRNVIDHAIRAEIAPDGTVSFYIHPHGHDGDTLDFYVSKNVLFDKRVIDTSPLPPGETISRLGVIANNETLPTPAKNSND